MKIDAYIKYTDTLSADIEDVVYVDMDYVSDREDIISYVEEELRRKYGYSQHYGDRFEITNLDDLVEEVENSEYCDEE